MLRTMCKSKITNAVVSGSNIRYSGSLGIDKAIMEKADILAGEQVHVLNMNNGERFVTYAIEEDKNSGDIVLYGPAVRKGEIGDELVILTYCQVDNQNMPDFKTLYVDVSQNG